MTTRVARRTLRFVRRILASLLALWAIVATTGVDATVYFCAGMQEVSQHPCCADDEPPAHDTIEAPGRACCAAAHLDQDETTTFESQPLRVAVAVQVTDAPAAPVFASVLGRAHARARAPPGGPPLYLAHEAFLI